MPTLILIVDSQAVNDNNAHTPHVCVERTEEEEDMKEQHPLSFEFTKLDSL